MEHKRLLEIETIELDPEKDAPSISRFAFRLNRKFLAATALTIPAPAN